MNLVPSLQARGFHALGNAVRMRIVELLAERERTAGQLASAFDVSRPAVSRHLRVLRDAGLVEWEDRAQERLYRLAPTELEGLGSWLEDVRTRWGRRLDALEAHLDRHPSTGPSPQEEP